VHLLIEKPLAVTMEGVVQLQQLVRDKKNIVNGVAYVYRAHPALAAMRAAIATGEFGKALQIVAVSGQNFPTYRPAYRYTYYASHATGGGAVQDALTHIINAGEWLVGPVDSLAADAAHLSLPGVEVEDTVNVLTRHGSAMGSFSLNQHQSPNESTITVICERGTARFEYHACRWRAMQRPDGEWVDHPFGPLERDELFTRQANAFLDAVEGKRRPLCSLDEGIATLRVNIAILKSVRERAWTSVS
jgi:predicted dehydrogenase